MKRFVPILLLASLLLGGEALACTSAIVAPRTSSEGVPLLWKHRDSPFINTRVEYIKGDGYAYTAIVPNTKAYRRTIFAGINEKGLGIMTTATSNLPITPKENFPKDKPRHKGSLSCRALKECATVDEFEAILRSEVRKQGFKSNLGVADATGVVAYFEVWDTGYKRYDDAMTAGFDVRSNFSRIVPSHKHGASVRRHDIIVQEMSKQQIFTPHDFIAYSRSHNSIAEGDVLANNNTHIMASHIVPNNNSVAAVVLICDGAEPRMLVMNGHPASSMAVPVYVRAEHQIPKCVNGEDMKNLGIEFRAKAYRQVANRLTILNKEVMRKVLAVNSVVKIPQQMPKDITAFNAKIDSQFAKYERRIQRILSKF